MNILIANDTRVENHHGCSRVMNCIDKNISKRGQFNLKYMPLLHNWSNYENWEEAGAIWTHDRASQQFKQILHEYEQPYLDPSITEELQEFVAKRSEEGGAPTDY